MNNILKSTPESPMFSAARVLRTVGEGTSGSVKLGPTRSSPQQ